MSEKRSDFAIGFFITLSLLGIVCAVLLAIFMM